MSTPDASRRHFLKTTSIALIGAAVPLHCCHHLVASALPAPGLQLWSLREDMAHDVAATLRAVAAMDYREVEGFGFDNGRIFNLPFQDFINLLRDAGLRMPSVHRAFSLKDYDAKANALTDFAKRDLDMAAAAGLRYVVWAWVPESDRADFGLLTRACQAIGEQAQRAGLRFAYHNHDYEFNLRGPDQRLLIEWLLEEVDARVMDVEMDLYWVAFAGQQPLDWIKRYPGRWRLCHVKDMDRTTKRETAVIGEGSIDFTSIFRERKKAGFEYYFVELEHYKGTPLEEVARSRQGFLNLKI